LFKPIQNSPVRAMLLGLYISHTSRTKKLIKTALKFESCTQSIKSCISQSFTTAKIKMLINYKHITYALDGVNI